MPTQRDITDPSIRRASRPPTSGGRSLPTWHALYTRARHEKKVHQRLRERGFEVYLPLISRERRWHDRTTTVDWPLFPGYVFVRVRRDAISQVLGVPGVLTVVRHDGTPAPIREKVIEDVRRLAIAVAKTGTLPEVAPMVRRGRRVRVGSGPLEGVEGVVVERRGSGRVLFEVGLDVIGQGLKLEMDTASLRAIEEEEEGEDEDEEELEEAVG